MPPSEFLLLHTLLSPSIIYRALNYLIPEKRMKKILRLILIYINIINILPGSITLFQTFQPGIFFMKEQLEKVLFKGFIQHKKILLRITLI